MKPSAMPPSADKSAARGVARRSRSAKGAARSSIMPALRQATRPKRQAASAASSSLSPRPLAAKSSGSMTRKTKANSDTVLTP
jgi:hypothetical protein